MLHMQDVSYCVWSLLPLKPHVFQETSKLVICIYLPITWQIASCKLPAAGTLWVNYGIHINTGYIGM